MQTAMPTHTILADRRPVTLAVFVAPGLAEQVIRQWQASGYGVPDAVADGSELRLPIRRDGSAPVTLVIRSPRPHLLTADVDDPEVLRCVRLVGYLDDLEPVTGAYEQVRYEPEVDARHLERFHVSGYFTFPQFCRHVFDLWLACQGVCDRADALMALQGTVDRHTRTIVEQAAVRGWKS